MSSHSNKSSRIVDENAAEVRIPDGDSDVDGSVVGGRKSRVAGSSADGSMEAGLRFPVLDRYRQVGEPIEGGMGVVYRALDVHLDIDVAIKRIRPKYAREAELIKRFEREAKVQVKLRHPHLVQVKDYSRDTLGPFIVMDWIDGRSLAEVIKQDGPMDWRTAALLISKVAMALQVAHENNIIHRDVKPANILLDQKGEPFITDFGLARAEVSVDGASETNKDAVLGTMHFMSPEQMRNPKDVTYLSDLWSLGATLYQLLTTHDVLAMRERLIPERLRDIVVQATERAPADRFGTMKLFAQALVHAANANVETKPAGVKPVPEEEGIAEVYRRANERVEKAHAEAKSVAEKRQDYTEAVRILETVPEHLRKTKLYNELIRRRDRVVELDTLIRDCVAQMKSEGLRAAVTELLKLQPNRADIKKLLEQSPLEPAPRAAGGGFPLDKIRGDAAKPAAAAAPAAPAGVSPLDKIRAAGSKPAAAPAAPAAGGSPFDKIRAAARPAPTTTPEATKPATMKPSRPPLLVAPFGERQAKLAQQEWAKYLGIDVEVTNGLGMKFRVIPPGTFDMGSLTSEPQRVNSETRHMVTITQPKLFGVYPVTQGGMDKGDGQQPKSLQVRRWPGHQSFSC